MARLLLAATVLMGLLAGTAQARPPHTFTPFLGKEEAQEATRAIMDQTMSPFTDKAYRLAFNGCDRLSNDHVICDVWVKGDRLTASLSSDVRETRKTYVIRFGSVSTGEVQKPPKPAPVVQTPPPVVQQPAFDSLPAPPTVSPTPQVCVAPEGDGD